MMKEKLKKHIIIGLVESLNPAILALPILKFLELRNTYKKRTEILLPFDIKTYYDILHVIIYIGAPLVFVIVHILEFTKKITKPIKKTKKLKNM